MAPAYIMLTGPLLVGSFLSYFLFGAFFIQLHVYVTEFMHADKKFFVGLVSAVTIAEILHLVFTTHTAYQILAEGFADLSSLTSSPWSGSALPTLNGFVSFCTQLFFAWRVERLGPKNIYARVAAIGILLLALMQFSASIAVTVQFIQLGLKVDLLKTLNKTVIIWLAGTLACDVLMTGSVIVVLMHYKKSTTYSESKSLIDSFIAHTIENGALTTICAALNLIFFLVYPNNFLYVCLEFILGRLYANVLMATLNRRDRKRITGPTEPSMSEKSQSNGGQAMPLANLRSLQHLRSTRMSAAANVYNGERASGERGAANKFHPIVSITTEVQVDDDDSASLRKHSGDVGVRYAV